MKNRYPKDCGICRCRVPAGEGTVQGSHASGWTVLHGTCPRDSVTHGHAHAYLRRAVKPIRRRAASADDISESLLALQNMLRTGWTVRSTVERIVLAAPAFRSMDRMEVEEIMEHCFSGESVDY